MIEGVNPKILTAQLITYFEHILVYNLEDDNKKIKRALDYKTQ